MTTLVIVESVKKVEKIGPMLGSGYKVMASVGHVRDLPVAHPCPTCSKPLRRIKGQHGFFWACSDRECKTTLPDAKGKPGERKAPPPPTGIACPKCGKELAHRVGTSKPVKRGMKPRPYDFYSCTGFPKCDAKYNTGPDGKPVFGDDAKHAQEVEA